MPPGGHVQVSGEVCCQEAGRRGGAGQQDPRIGRWSWSVWLPPGYSVTQAGGLEGKPKAGTSYLEGRRAEFALETSQETQSGASG